MVVDNKRAEFQQGSIKRTALLKRNILASFLIKGWSVGMQLLLVPLTLHCLGAYKNGLWLTVSSMLLWIDNLDIGLGNGMRNRLAECIACKQTDEAKKVVASTLFMLIVIVVPLCFLINVLVANIDLYSILNVDKNIVKDLDTILYFTIIVVCLTFIFKFIGNFYMGLQLPAINNMLVALGHTLTVLGISVAYSMNCDSLLIISLIYTLSPLCIYIIGYVVTFYGKYSALRPRKANVKVRMMKDLLNIGIKFFVLQIVGVILFLSSNILISRLFSPELVTPYQIAYKYSSVALLLFTIICTPFWTATTDAYKHGDKEWMMRSKRMLDRLLVIISVILLMMLVIAKPVFSLWIGNSIKIPFSMTAWVSVYVFILIFSLRYSYILNGLGALRLQLIVTVIAAILFIPTSLAAVHFSNNINCFLCAMCCIHLPGLVVNKIQYKKIINGKASGLWLR